MSTAMSGFTLLLCRGRRALGIVTLHNSDIPESRCLHDASLEDYWFTLNTRHKVKDMMVAGIDRSVRTRHTKKRDEELLLF